MRDLPYYLLDPTGNVTVLAELPPQSGKGNDLPEIAEKLMALEPTAEQVGFLGPGDTETDVSLTMAGGEFCGNATLSAAAVYLHRRDAEKKGRNTENEASLSAGIRIRVSGAERPVPVTVRRTAPDCYEGTVEMPGICAVREEQFLLDGTRYRFPVVYFPGIAHVIAEQPLEKAFAEKAVAKWCEDLHTDALGIMQLDASAGILLPLVYVRTAGTLYWEHSCASGTAAAGAFLARREGKERKTVFCEPGGSLAVSASPCGKLLLSGNVKIRKYPDGRRNEG